MTDNFSSKECESDEEQSSSKKRCNLVVPRIELPDHASAESRAGEEPTVSSLVSSNEPAWSPQENYVPMPMLCLSVSSALFFFFTGTIYECQGEVVCSW